MTITKIEETNFEHNGEQYDGFVISFSDNTCVKIGIDSGAQCCEVFGYLISEDDLKSFIGSEFIRISVVDKELKKYPVIDELIDEQKEIMFIDIETNLGTFQIVAYNNHNGYYSHTGVVISRDLKYEVRL